jgi:DNA-binding PadR family transcriptional regulator
MANRIRMSPQTGLVLQSLLAEPKAWIHGYDISRRTGLKSGTLYPILIRLAANRLLETRWEQAEPGRPPRHMYRLTRNGAQQARRLLSAAESRGLPPFQAEGQCQA